MGASGEAGRAQVIEGVVTGNKLGIFLSVMGNKPSEGFKQGSQLI